MMTHGDDGAATAYKEDLVWMRQMFPKHFECKVGEIVGLAEYGAESQVAFLLKKKIEVVAEIGLTLTGNMKHDTLAERLALHAARLEFEHPSSGATVVAVAPRRREADVFGGRGRLRAVAVARGGDGQHGRLGRRGERRERRDRGGARGRRPASSLRWSWPCCERTPVCRIH